MIPKGHPLITSALEIFNHTSLRNAAAAGSYPIGNNESAPVFNAPADVPAIIS